MGLIQHGVYGHLAHFMRNTMRLTKWDRTKFQHWWSSGVLEAPNISNMDVYTGGLTTKLR